jgi:thioredoxin 1
MADLQVQTLNSGNFDEMVLKSSTPVMVDFWAAWCGPCKMITPVVEQIAEQYAGKLVVGKLNVDDQADIAARYGVMSIPTLLFFRDGEVTNKVVGYRPAAELVQILDQVLAE